MPKTSMTQYSQNLPTEKSLSSKQCFYLFIYFLCISILIKGMEMCRELR